MGTYERERGEKDERERTGDRKKGKTASMKDEPWRKNGGVETEGIKEQEAGKQSKAKQSLLQ